MNKHLKRLLLGLSYFTMIGILCYLTYTFPSVALPVFGVMLGVVVSYLAGTYIEELIKK